MNDRYMGPAIPFVLVRVLIAEPIAYSQLGGDYAGNWKVAWKDLELIENFVRPVLAIAIGCGADELRAVPIHSPTPEHHVYAGVSIVVDDPVYIPNSEKIKDCKATLSYALKKLLIQDEVNQSSELTMDRKISSLIDGVAQEFSRKHPGKKISSPLFVEILDERFFVAGFFSYAAPSKPIETSVETLTGRIDGVSYSGKSFNFIQESGATSIAFNPEFVLRKLCEKLAAQEETSISILRTMGGNAKIQAILKDIIDEPPA